jgi:hypothetical protein
MNRKWVERLTPRRPWLAWAALGTVVVIVVAIGMFWWGPGTFGGRPRLVLDQDRVDLGDLAFAAPARAVFTLTNAGDGALTITEEVRVTALKGC